MNARKAELFAINNIAYGIAQDIAAGIDSSEPLEPIAEQYAQEMAEAIKAKEDEDNLDSYRDTFAFVTLVIEGRKVVPNVDQLRNARLLVGGVVARLEKIKNPSRLERSALKQARAHLEAARQLAPE